MISDFVVLKVMLLCFEFKSSSVSMFIPMGRGILQVSLQKELYEYISSWVRGLCF